MAILFFNHEEKLRKCLEIGNVRKFTEKSEKGRMHECLSFIIARDKLEHWNACCSTTNAPVAISSFSDWTQLSIFPLDGKTKWWRLHVKYRYSERLRPESPFKSMIHTICLLLILLLLPVTFVFAAAVRVARRARAPSCCALCSAEGAGQKLKQQRGDAFAQVEAGVEHAQQHGWRIMQTRWC